MYLRNAKGKKVSNSSTFISVSVELKTVLARDSYEIPSSH